MTTQTEEDREINAAMGCAALIGLAALVIPGVVVFWLLTVIFG